MHTLLLAGLALSCAVHPAAADWPSAPPFVRPDEPSGPLPASVSVTPIGPGAWRLRVHLPSTFEAESVHLAGSFNGWDGGALPMERGADGRWAAELEARSGRLSYKFVVDGRSWIPDPSNDDREPDGHGGENTVLTLGAAGARADALTEGERRRLAWGHAPDLPVYLQRAGDGAALIRYRGQAGLAPRLSLEGADAPLPMTPAGSLDGFTFYECRVPLTEEAQRYTFLVETEDGVRRDPVIQALSEAALPEFRTPEWAKHATWYQLMPDRFRNGDPENDRPGTRPWTSDWYEASPGEAGETVDGRPLGLWDWFIYKRLYGGDLAGVREKLDHIASLGVTALYFNPVFEAESHHKYEATDYRHVDSSLGAGEDWSAVAAGEDLLDPSTWTWSPSDRLFLDLIEECHARGLKVVIDGVWNHVGQRHPAFADVVQRGPESPYADWFDVVSWEPFVHRGWAGYDDLPVFAKDSGGLASDAVVAHIHAVTRRWMDPDGDGDPSDGIDGWRLDVPMEVPMPFWDEWRQLVKSVNPDAYLSGEVWDRADVWLDGRRFDAVMNYRFADAAIAWIGFEDRKITPTALDQRLAELRLAYPAEATYALMNLVDSHDTDRMVSMFLNPDRRYDADNREQDNEAYLNRKPDPLHYRRARLAALLQMTYVGAPMIYYGDEVGMWGPDDPSNRKPMLWPDLGPYERKEDRVDPEHLAHYRAVGELRRGHPALRTGAFETLAADDEQDLLVFLREDAGERLLVALNASGRPARFVLPDGEWEAVHGDHGGARELVVPAIDGVVLVQRR